MCDGNSWDPLCKVTSPSLMVGLERDESDEGTKGEGLNLRSGMVETRLVRPYLNWLGEIHANISDSFPRADTYNKLNDVVVAAADDGGDYPDNQKTSD